MLSIFTQFLSNRSQHLMVDGCRSKLVNVVSGVTQGSVLGPLLFFRYTSELFSILDNKLIGYADGSTLIAFLPSPLIRVTVAESLSRDLVKVSEWCDRWEMKSNASKTKIIIVSRSRTMHPQSPALTIGRTVLKESDDLIILGVTFGSKMTFGKPPAPSPKHSVRSVPHKEWHNKCQDLSYKLTGWLEAHLCLP